MGGVDGATEGGLVEASGGVPAVNLRSGVDAALLDKPPRPAGVGLRLTRGGMSDCDEGSEGIEGGDPSPLGGGPPLPLSLGCSLHRPRPCTHTRTGYVVALGVDIVA